MSDLAILGTYSVFVGSYIVFALGKFPGMKIDRHGAAIIGAVLIFITGAVHVDNSLRLIHFGTVVLLFSMMLVVACLHLAGFFDWVTELVVTRLKPHHMLPTVIFLSGLLSAFFVNDNPRGTASFQMLGEQLPLAESSHDVCPDHKN